MGTPVILSDIDVNKEILLDHVKFFITGNEESLTHLMKQFVDMRVRIADKSDLSKQMFDNQKSLGNTLYEAIQYTLKRYET